MLSPQKQVNNAVPRGNKSKREAQSKEGKSTGG
jgi:hypothetical protein